MPLYDFKHLSFPLIPLSIDPLSSPFTRPQRCPHYGPLQEPPQCPSRAEWHSIAMEKLSRLCDWLLVNKEGSVVWGLWGAHYRRERGRITMTGSEKGLQHREENTGTERVGQSTPLLIATISSCLTGSSLTRFDTLNH